MPSSDTIFLNARELRDVAERARYVSEACGRDAALQERVEEMLRAAEEAADYFAEDTAFVDSQRHPSEGPGVMIGRYELIEKIGEGGMGVVYLAEQREPVKRPVALKIIKLGMDTKAVVARFEAERQTLALMDHPSIAKVFDAGVTESGRSYFVMELVRGVPITRYCDENKVSMAGRLELFLEVCSAIEHAHQKGVIHRDIKPSNILVTMYGDRPVPKVIDFGIAKATQDRLTENTVVTQFQQFVGTPAYMSPEQASFSGTDIDTRTDIYSLGVLLYELLAGRTPFDAKELADSGLEQMCRTIREREPARPSTWSTRRRNGGVQTNPQTELNRDVSVNGDVAETDGTNGTPQIDPDLDWIAMKCLEKDRAHRYETVNALAADIRRHLQNEVVIARPPSARLRIRKAVRRNKTAFLAGSAVMVALLVGMALTAWQSFGRKRALVELRRTLYISQIQQVRQAWKDGDIEKAQNLLRAQIPKPGEEDLRGWEWRYFWKLCRDGSAVTISNEFGKKMFSIAISPDASLLATGDEAGQIELRRTSDWAVVNDSMRHFSNVRSVQFTPDGRFLLSAGDNSVRFWDVASGRERSMFLVTNQWNAMFSARLSPDGLLVAATTMPGQIVHVWDAKTGEILVQIESGLASLRKVDFSPDGSLLAFHDGASEIGIWDVQSRSFTRKLESRVRLVGALKFSPDGSLLTVSDADGAIRLWSTQDWREAGILYGHGNRVTAVSFSKDGRFLASACTDRTLKLWDLSSKTEIQTFYGHTFHVDDLVIFPDEGRMASASSDNTVRIWKLPETKRERRFQKESIAWGHAPAFSPDGRVFVTISTAAPSERQLWDAESGSLITTWTNAHSKFDTAALGGFSPDSRVFAAPGQSNGVLVWSMPEGRLRATLPTGTNQVDTLVFSKEGDLFAAGKDDQIVRRWSAKTFNSRASFNGFERGVSGLFFSPDGKILAAWCPDGNIHLLETATGSSLRPIFHTHDWPAMGFSPDSKLLTVASAHGTDLWDITTGEKIHLNGSPAVFSPDGKILAVSSGAGNIELWDMKTRRVTRRLNWTGGWAHSVAFSPDGATLVSCDSHVTLRMWSVRMTREVITFPSAGDGYVYFSPDGNTLLRSSFWNENQILTASSFAEVGMELADEAKAHE